MGAAKSNETRAHLESDPCLLHILSNCPMLFETQRDLLMLEMQPITGQCYLITCILAWNKTGFIRSLGMDLTLDALLFHYFLQHPFLHQFLN